MLCPPSCWLTLWNAPDADSVSLRKSRLQWVMEAGPDGRDRPRYWGELMVTELHTLDRCMTSLHSLRQAWMTF